VHRRVHRQAHAAALRATHEVRGRVGAGREADRLRVSSVRKLQVSSVRKLLSCNAGCRYRSSSALVRACQCTASPFDKTQWSGSAGRLPLNARREQGKRLSSRCWRGL
jgi:hypothetical protein